MIKDFIRLIFSLQDHEPAPTIAVVNCFRFLVFLFFMISVATYSQGQPKNNKLDKQIKELKTELALLKKQHQIDSINHIEQSKEGKKKIARLNKQLDSIIQVLKPKPVKSKGQSKSKWESFKNDPLTPIWDKLNIIVTIILAGASLFLSIVAFNQQQKIAGMDQLLRKQDTIITSLTKLNEPIVGFYGDVFHKIDTTPLDKNYNYHQLEYSCKNYGGRIAQEVNMNVTFIFWKNDGWVEGQQHQQSFPSLRPSQIISFILHIAIPVKENNQNFENTYLVIETSYVDAGTGNQFELIEFGKHIILNNELRFSYLSDPQLSSLREYFKVVKENWKKNGGPKVFKKIPKP